MIRFLKQEPGTSALNLDAWHCAHVQEKIASAPMLNFQNNFTRMTMEKEKWSEK
ncbi:MAG: hypothetical protein H6696_03905 [Deferribacteres bacterium]|nr:hypothetical protein [candidate division KSB1 bacterium]MCB9501057.1 hypothetical protein [Deferribacteres bacterium]